MVAHHAAVRHIGYIHFGADQGDFEIIVAARSANGEADGGARKAAHDLVEGFGVFAFGVFAVHGDDLVAGFEAGLVGGKALVEFGDGGVIAYFFAGSADAVVTAFRGETVRLNVCFGDVVGEGIKGAYHGVNAGAHEFAGVHLVHIVHVEFAIDIGVNLDVAGDFEEFVAYRRETCRDAQAGSQHYGADDEFVLHNCQVDNELNKCFFVGSGCVGERI